MCSVPTDHPAAEKARWLAEISAALEAARDALLSLDLSIQDQKTAGDLYLSIEAAQFEVRSLRLSRSLKAGPLSSEVDQISSGSHALG